MTPTKAQQKFLREHLDALTSVYLRLGLEDGYRPRHLGERGSPTYDFVGRVSEAGWVEIVNGENLSWPHGWKGTRLTDVGRSLLEHGEPKP